MRIETYTVGRHTYGIEAQRTLRRTKAGRHLYQWRILRDGVALCMPWQGPVQWQNAMRKGREYVTSVVRLETPR